MNLSSKKKQLYRYKALATGLFILMAIVFIITTLLQKNNPAHWIGYLRAFSEAAMVGALADWFAVTALFNYPMGLKIPHTNLIENSKQRIGDNLGNFVVENFVSAGNIRPYIEKIELSNTISKWLVKEHNQKLFIEEASLWIENGIEQIDDLVVTTFIAKKVQALSDQLPLNEILSGGIDYLIENNEHQAIITQLSIKVKDYITDHQQLIQEKVSAESYSFIPQFIDHKIASKISSGLIRFIEDIIQESSHPIRTEIAKNIRQFSYDLRHTLKWNETLEKAKSSFLSSSKIQQYSGDIWANLKSGILEELRKPNSTLKKQIQNSLQQFAQQLNSDPSLQRKLDHWIRYNSYKLILKNAQKVSELISNTVGNWEGKELSRKLELEVGKDLQFIRINGTIVGGLVGLIIYTIAHLFL
ncbi:DUF445 domain-containing protein [Elizabethkingia sp. JS20170427COW]|uniref:DUF445 domain-containing protein n=1 Tax=Elizabethkingia sp. JS20170427COW TaxID=2583851 RepID=UPI001110E8DD|nr:DUF445 domain-containing protein [Elizabethkingia sp. JS20170427COW]QCX53157.1 DUF445 domain-containing protein [Elizabethkingia sp. JS20170427COW]